MWCRLIPNSCLRCPQRAGLDDVGVGLADAPVGVCGEDRGLLCAELKSTPSGAVESHLPAWVARFSIGSVTNPGHAAFVERLTRFAAEVDDPGVDAVVASASVEPTVSVRGRPGVGRSSVAHALGVAGMAVTDHGDVDVHVVAEVVKPEDEQAVRASARPVLLVLNKADLVTGARALCARWRALTGRPTVPMVAHLADVHIDDALLTGPREDLFEILDSHGTAHAVTAVRAGADAAAVKRLLRMRSCVDGVVAALAPLLAVSAGTTGACCAGADRGDRRRASRGVPARRRHRPRMHGRGGRRRRSRRHHR